MDRGRHRNGGVEVSYSTGGGKTKSKVCHWGRRRRWRSVEQRTTVQTLHGVSLQLLSVVQTHHLLPSTPARRFVQDVLELLSHTTDTEYKLLRVSQ